MAGGEGPANLTIRAARADDLPAVAAIIEDGFAACVAGDFTDEGRAVFRAYAAPEAIAARLKRSNAGLVALRDGRVVGYLEIDGDHIRLLFVGRDHLRRGIAHALLAAASKDRAGRTITVHSSPYAVPAYERLGFHATATMQTKNGMTFLPMALTLPDGDETL